MPRASVDDTAIKSYVPVAANGAVWKRQRQMMNPAFEMARISEVFQLMMDAAQAKKGELSEEELQKVAGGTAVGVLTVAVAVVAVAAT